MTQQSPALLVVDVQNDFCPGGALPVNNGDLVVEPLNEAMNLFHKMKRPIYCSRDWHSHTTKHFKDFGGIWPMHCVRTTWGARFHPDLLIPKGAYILDKGTDPDTDGYSAFEGKTAGQTLDERLTEDGTNVLYVGGLATDYCVKNSVLDALKRPYLKKVYLLTNACRAVNLKIEDEEIARAHMLEMGAIFIKTDDICI